MLNGTGSEIAAGEASGGDLYASYKLQQVGNTDTVTQKLIVSTLTRLEVDLNAFAAGTLTAQEQGSINQLLAQEKLNLPTNVNQNVASDLTQIANIFLQGVVAGPGGTVTPIQALAQGQIKNITNGIQYATSNAIGKWQITNPAGWPAPSS
jgi:hypothetical protein